MGRKDKCLSPTGFNALILCDQLQSRIDMPFDPTRPGEGRARNVLGGALQPCSAKPLTGFSRNGCRDTGPQDVGLHVVCAQMTREFLDFAVARGNDLVAPVPEFEFPGLNPGDRWCVCAARWLEARDGGVPPPVILGATHEAVLQLVSLEDLKKHALDRE